MTDGPPRDRYRTLDELGAGAFGTVTRRFDRRLRRLVATKEAHAAGDRARRALVGEAQLLAYLDHPGVVPIYDVDTDSASGAYTMRLLRGRTLDARLEHVRRSGAVLPVSEALRIVGRIAETMENAHDKGLLHLDLKPQNVMVDAHGQVSIIDWGTSRFYDRGRYEDFLRSVGADDVETIPPRASGGTPAYMPAEQMMEGPDRLGPTADVFAVGTILYELISGDLPFPQSEMRLAFIKVLHTPPTLSELRADVPARVSALCSRMLDPEPARRPASFGEVLAEITALGEPSETAEERTFAAGDVLFVEGETGNVAFQILSGAVAVTVQGRHGPREVARRGLGDVIGEMALLSHAPRSATVTALEPTRVRVLTAEVVEHELSKVSPVIAHMTRSLADRLREQLAQADANPS